MKKSFILPLVSALIVCALAFYGGMKYGQSASLSNNRQGRFQQLGGLPGNPGSGFSMRGDRQGMNRQGTDFTVGEILAKDEKSLTVKLRDGGSKIIFLSDSAQIMKTSAGTLEDLTVGEQVSVVGSSNADGSLSAQSIQIRPPFEKSDTMGL